ncbi:MAG: hypothetical protein GKR91_12535 [Pseudomonadales bacterium]|nr:hypothetical protein [Pseudomonadales bacterium]
MTQYYEGLSNFELISLIHSSQTLSIAFFSVFITILFAYLVVAYFAAKRLSKFQMITVSALYSFAIFFTVIGIYDSTRNIDLIEQVLTEASYEPSIVNSGFNILLIIAWVVSIVFFVQARRAK